MYVAAVTLAVVLGVGFGAFGIAKLFDLTPMAQMRSHLGLPRSLFAIVGGFEVLGGAGLIIGAHDDLPVIGVLASLGLIGLTIGAGFYHQKAGDPMRRWLPAVAVGSVVILHAILRIASA